MTNRSRDRFRFSTLAATVAAVAIAAGVVRVHAAHNVQRVDLVATPVTPAARGWTTLHVSHGATTTFVVSARALAPHAAFDVVVDGVKVGSLTTSGGGNGKLRFRSRPRGHDAVLGFDPQGADVVIRDHDGHDCLIGSGHPGDSASGACCLPDGHDDGEHCAPLAAARCTAKGGTVPTTNSCFPNPCATPPPVDTVACCIPDSARGAHVDEDGDVDCHELTSAACAAAGGTVVTATSCHPNPCAPVPPADKIACCVTEHEGDTDCKQMTSERCTSLGGSAAGAFCDPDPCGGSDDDGEHGHGHDGGDHGHHGGHWPPWGGGFPGSGHGGEGHKGGRR